MYEACNRHILVFHPLETVFVRGLGGPEQTVGSGLVGHGDSIADTVGSNFLSECSFVTHDFCVLGSARKGRCIFFVIVRIVPPFFLFFLALLLILLGF